MQLIPFRDHSPTLEINPSVGERVYVIFYIRPLRKPAVWPTGKRARKGTHSCGEPRLLSLRVETYFNLKRPYQPYKLATNNW